MTCIRLHVFSCFRRGLWVLVCCVGSFKYILWSWILYLDCRVFLAITFYWNEVEVEIQVKRNRFLPMKRLFKTQLRTNNLSILSVHWDCFASLVGLFLQVYSLNLQTPSIRKPYKRHIFFQITIITILIFELPCTSWL